MDLKLILNRLTEEELVFLQEVLGEDMDKIIVQVIDDKRQPSLFAQQIEKGDVFINMDITGRKFAYRIVTARNPRFITECLSTNGLEVSYSGYVVEKASDIIKWKKVDAAVWDRLNSYYVNQQAAKKRVEMEYSQGFDSYWDVLNKGRK